MNVFGWLTGGAKSADKVIDGIINGADALVFTKQEQSEFDIERQKLWLDIQKTLAQESAPQAVNRRIFVWAIVLMTAFMTLTALAYTALGMFDMAANVIKVGAAFGWDLAFSLAVGCYFGTHIVSKAVGKK